MIDTSTQQSDTSFTGLAWLDRSCSVVKNQQRSILFFGAAFQLVVLLTIIATPLHTLMTGDTILLRVVPVDPRDMFRGDYVILSYEFSQVPAKGIKGLNPNDNQGRTVYVTLVPAEDGKHWQASRFTLKKPDTGKFLRGKITDWNRIAFGIESYFVQEGKGLKFEQAARSKNLSAEIALNKNGYAVLKRLLID